MLAARKEEATSEMLEYPAPVVIVEDFVARAGAEQLLQYAVAHESGFRPAKVALKHEGIIDESRRVSKVNSDVDPVLPLIDPVIRKAVDEVIPKLGLVNVAPYFLELELTWCGDGGFFKMHADTLRYRPSPRVVSMVYYFHKEPKAFTGGQLRLHGLGADENSRIYQEIEPRVDRAVFFPSWFPHEVLPVRCSSGAFADGRFALSCWVRKALGRGP